MGAVYQRVWRDEFFRNSLLVFVAQMAVNVANFGFHFVVSRRIGVVAYGTLNALVSGYQVLLVPSLIATTVLVKYSAELQSAERYGQIRTLLKRCLVLFGGCAGGLFIVALASAGHIATYLHISDRLPIILMAAIVALNLLLPIRGILQGVERFKPFSLSLSLEAAAKMVGAIVFTALGWGLVGALGGWIFGCFLAFAYTWSAEWSWLRRSAREVLDFRAREVILTSGGVTLATLFVTSLGFSDVILVKHFFDATSAGLYGAAALCGKMLYFLVYFLPAVVLPRVAVKKLQGKPTQGILIAALAATLILGGAGALFYRFFSLLVVQTLAGSAFASAAPLVFPYGVAAILFAALNLAVVYKIGLGRFDFVLPLGLTAALQITFITFFHPSTSAVVGVLILCNIVGLLSVLTPFERLAETISYRLRERYAD